jgi:hypothetical protein
VTESSRASGERQGRRVVEFFLAYLGPCVS